MRVVFDATAIPSDRGGVGRYVDALLPALAGLGVQLTVASQVRDVEAFRLAVPTAEIVPVPSAAARRAGRLAWEQVELPRLARRMHADVLHSPHYTMPRWSPVPVVVTLHDATFFSHPNVHSAVKRQFFQSRIRAAVRHAAALVVPSRATGSEVRRFVGGAQEIFHVAYHGVDTAAFHPVDAAEKARVARSLGVGVDGYVAFLGTLEPRKNVPALIRAWVSAVSQSAHPPALVLAGGAGWDARVDPTVASVPAGLNVLRPGYLPLADLPGFLGGASVVAYPSLGEGFGLPVLEAMACGSAVLTTRELSLPEVGGDAVAYSGIDSESISDVLRELLTDRVRREELSSRAADRAREFTWERSARQHVEAYHAAMARGR